jgi:hypothetical protein
MTDPVSLKGSSVEGAGVTADVPAEAHHKDGNDRYSTTDRDEEKESTIYSDEGEEEKDILPLEASVIGGGGIVLEPKHQADAAASDFHNHPVLDEKVTHVEPSTTAASENDANGVANDVEAGKDGVVGEGDEDDDEANRVYPGGLQLALLTFGLCMATFVVALGEYHNNPGNAQITD